MSKPLDVVIGDFLLAQLKHHRRASASLQEAARPLFCGLQGPQGSGKTYLANALKARLGSEPHKLRICFVSIDDLYFPFDTLRNLKIKHPCNPLLDGRGLPGTHDLPLGLTVLEGLKEINDPSSSIVHLPIFDKSRHAGLGDRSTETLAVNGPLDIVVVEGWMVGFAPLTPSKLEQAFTSSTLPNPYAKLRTMPKTKGKLDLSQPIFKHHELANLQTVNSMLFDYTEQLWPFLNCFFQILPEDMAYTFDWRLQQEHTMKAKNGGKGMTDEQVMAFVARYMPGYELFGAGVQSGLEGAENKPPWIGRGKAATINRAREVIDVTEF